MSIISALGQIWKLIESKHWDEANKFWETQIEPKYKELENTTMISYNEESRLADVQWVNLQANQNQAKKCRSALERLILTNSIHWQKAVPCKAILENLAPALQVSRRLKFADIGISDYKPTNPSIVASPIVPGEWWVNVRYVNYHCNEKNEYHCNNPNEKVVHTKSVFYAISKTFQTTCTFIWEDKTTFLKWPSPVMDLEDVRIVTRGNELLCTATSREVLASTEPQIVLCKMNIQTRKITGGLRLIAPKLDEQYVCQKNWLPFVDSTGSLCVVYTFGPMFQILEVDEITGQCTVKHEFPTGLRFQDVRGGSAPVPMKFRNQAGYICTVHYAYDQPNVRRHYLHRFIWLDMQYRPKYVSQSWTLHGAPLGIEFVMSAVASGDSILLSYGKNDIEAYLAEVAVSTICDLEYFAIA